MANQFITPTRPLVFGEKPSRHFFILEKERIEKSYGKSIYNSDKTFSQQNLLHEINKFLSDEECDLCEGFISLSELLLSVKSLHILKKENLDHPPRYGYVRYRFSVFWLQSVSF